MPARFVFTILLAIGFMLAGVIQYEIKAAVIKFSTADYAEYISEAGYVALYCKDLEVFDNESKSNESDFLDQSAAEGSGSHEDGDGEPYEGQYFQENRSEWRRHLPEAKVPLTDGARWEHNLYEAFLWGSLFGPAIASFLLSHLGPKRVIEVGLIGASIATLLVPAAWLTLAHYPLCIAQGVCTSMMWPAAQVFASRWYNPAERSTFLSYYATWTFGWTVAVLIGAPLMESIGRDSVFYTTSLLVGFWYIAWKNYITEPPPSIPPNISWTERSLINNATEDYAPELQPESYEENKFPIKAFILSGPLWACAIACFGSQWGFTSLLLAGNKFLQIVYGYSTNYNDPLSYLPYLGHLLCSLIFGFLADHCRAESFISTTTVRKILVYISHFLPGAIIFVIGYTGCDPSTPAALFTAALGLNGATSAGVYTSALEISPKYSGPIMGFVQTIGSAGALSASYLVKEGLYGSLSGTWCLVFGISSTVMVASAGVFLIFGSGTEQQWDHSTAGAVSLLIIGQETCNETADQQRELRQQTQTPEEIEQINRKNQVFSM